MTSGADEHGSPEAPVSCCCCCSNSLRSCSPSNPPLGRSGSVSRITATVDVPPGRYLVSVYRVDWDEMKKKDRSAYGDAGWGETVVLTPLAGDAPSDAAAVLQRNPGGARCAVEQAVQQRPIGDRV